MPLSTLHNTLVLLAGVAILALCCWLAWRLVRLAARLWAGTVSYIPQSRSWERTQVHRERFAVRFPRFARWFGARIDTQTFTGLPLSLLAVAAVYLLILLGNVVEELLTEQELQQIDDAVNAAFAPVRGPPLLDVFAWLTDLGASSTLSGVAIVAAALFWAYRRAYLIPSLLLTILGSQVMTWSGKYGFARARPEFVTGITAAAPSFPSAHSTSALAVIGFIAYAIAREPLSLQQRFQVVYWACVLILLIGLSRMFLSVHYASDVAAGFLVGGFWLLTGIALGEYLRQRSAA